MGIFVTISKYLCHIKCDQCVKYKESYFTVSSQDRYTLAFDLKTFHKKLYSEWDFHSLLAG